VDAVPGVRRVRFMSPHPFYLDEKTARAMGESRSVCRHMHLPAQSGSDAVLKRMRRNYTRAEFLRKAEVLHKAMPGIAVTTDLIVGFPGETEDDFQKTLSLPAEAGLDGGFIFKYSPRPGTESALWPDDVSDEVKEERHARLLEIVDALSAKRVAALVGTRGEIMVERADEASAEGRLESGRKVSFTPASPVKPGDFVTVEITAASGRSLEGKPV
jgi:tRNA-2-methylthio-N6-dimethylallyladenosine synthase